MKDIQKFEKALHDEERILGGELSKLGRKNPEHPMDWEAKPDEMDIERADENEVADKIESLEENDAIMSELEVQYNDVKAALARIKEGTYGICKVCNKEIEENRLEANPAAYTCIEHK